MINNGAVVWRSQLQHTVALSTMESEYMALTEATKELIWKCNLLAELGYFNNTDTEPDTESTKLYSDNQSAIALSKNPVSHARANTLIFVIILSATLFRIKSFGCNTSPRRR
jgi:hypothetical protein